MGAVTPVRDIIKRDGSSQPFDGARIARAITLAGAATGEFDTETADRLAAAVVTATALTLTACGAGETKSADLTAINVMAPFLEAQPRISTSFCRLGVRPCHRALASGRSSSAAANAGCISCCGPVR